MVERTLWPERQMVNTTTPPFKSGASPVLGNAMRTEWMRTQNNSRAETLERKREKEREKEKERERERERKRKKERNHLDMIISHASQMKMTMSTNTQDESRKNKPLIQASRDVEKDLNAQESQLVSAPTTLTCDTVTLNRTPALRQA